MDHSDYLDVFRDALRIGSHDVAFGLFRRFVATCPTTSLFMTWVEKSWTAFGQSIGRLTSLSEALQGARNDEIALRCIFVRVAFGAGQIPSALAASRKAMDRAPEEASPAFLLCIMLLKLEHRDAQGIMQHCLDRFPQPSIGWTDIGTLLLGHGKKKAALICFARGAPSFDLAMRRGLLAKELGQRDQAKTSFEEAVKWSPHSPRAWFLLGTCAQDDRKFATAAAAYDKVLSLAPAMAEAAVNLGTVLQETGDLAAAKAAYGLALRTRADTFGRIAQALTTSPKGELWLDLESLRSSLTGRSQPLGPE